jgi:hypothetical protein
MSPNVPPRKDPSPFGEVCPKLTAEKMAANIREEIRRLRRSKQLNFYGGQDVHGSQGSSSDGAMGSPGSPICGESVGDSSHTWMNAFFFNLPNHSQPHWNVLSL